jgi:dGTPase
MVGDVLEETRRRIAAAGVRSIEDVRAAGETLVGFSPGLNEQERALKRFLYRKLYNAPALMPIRTEAQRIVGNLTRHYRADPASLPPAWRIEGSALEQARQAGDFVAGMTDRFAIARHEELIGPVELPDRF